MAYQQNFLATDDEVLRRYRPFLLSARPTRRPTLYREGEAIQPPAIDLPPPELPPLPSAIEPRPVPEPAHPYRAQADEIYGEIQRMRQNAPDPGFLRTLAGRLVGGITTPELGGFITGETQHYRKLNRLGGQAQLLEGQLTREQQMQKTLEESAGRQAATRKDTEQAGLYGAQAEAARRPKPDEQIDEYVSEQGERVLVFQKPTGETYEQTLGKVRPLASETQQPAGVKEYEYARSQGFQGSFFDWKRRTSAAQLATSSLLTADELKRAGLPSGTVAQRDAKGKIDIVYQPKSGRVTGSQSTALRYLLRGLDATESVERVEGEIAKLGLGGQVALNALPNWLQSDEGKLYNQATKAFTEARLRKDSGAAIPLHEFENDRQMYFAQPGDTPEVLAQKRASRAAVLEGIAAESGPAYEEYFGEAFQPGSMKAKYGAGVDAVPQAGGQGQGAVAPPGAVAEVFAADGKTLLGHVVNGQFVPVKK